MVFTIVAFSVYHFCIVALHESSLSTPVHDASVAGVILVTHVFLDPCGKIPSSLERILLYPLHVAAHLCFTIKSWGSFFLAGSLMGDMIMAASSKVFHDVVGHFST